MADPARPNFVTARIAVCGALLMALAMISCPAAADKMPPPLQAILDVACDAPLSDPQRFRLPVPDARILIHDIDVMAGRPGRARTVLKLADGRKIEINALFPGGRLRRVGFELSDGHPRLSISVDHRCQVTEARDISYGDDGRADVVRVYGPDMTEVHDRITLNPPVPKGPDPGGAAVGLIDSGVNYTIHPFKERLARNDTGGLIGIDLWDGDDRPFDIDTARSPFFPLHHGSAVMSVLIREAPAARVVPIRYPRPDMTRMADAVAFLEGAGVRVVNLAMGSNDPDEWRAFAEAAAKRPQMLFIVSAGNDGRNIDRTPVYPAALGLPNTIVVTSSELDGRLAAGSNWGADSVDIMVPGERVEVIDHRGAPGKASGSSFAVPRVTALAVRYLAKYPDWHGPELRAAILKRARALDGPKRTRYGWIPDPTDGP